MGDVIEFPGFKNFRRDGWQFLIDQYVQGRRLQTHVDDNCIVVATADFESETGYSDALVEITTDERWRWEVETVAGIEDGCEETLSAAVAAAEASAIKSFRTGRNHFAAV